ncbi:MAG: aldehyde dehydrogenase family protein [Planctomycetota bacterium]|nr:MAG: aldehyde dehydrogenase family protein [Planctomycetota bacterium]
MTLTVRNPATGEAIETIETPGPDEIARRAARAEAAQRGWAATPLPERAAAIERFAAHVEAQREPLAQLLSRETGKPIRQARAELAGLAPRFRWFLERSPAVLAEQVLETDEASGTEQRLRWEPLGVVANISAWNYPWFVGVNVFVPALLAGNAVLYKPSEFATLTGREIARGMRQAGIAEDVFAFVPGGGAAGEALLAPPVRAVYFTGSYRTGRRVNERAAAHLMRVQLELGGKDPLYVTEDVSIGWAARAAAEGAMYNAGQSCCAVERIYVHEAIYPRFSEALVAEVERLRVGDPLDEATDVGPLCRPAQLEVLEAQVRDALEQGARLGCGGARLPGPGAYFAPTVLLDCHHGMQVMTEESFGPVIGLEPVANDEEALERMRDTHYGLTAAVFGADRERAQRILSQIETGTAYWNCCDRVSACLPWSGRRHSGIGATLGDEGIRAFAAPRAWHLRRPPMPREEAQP